MGTFARKLRIAELILRLRDNTGNGGVHTSLRELPRLLNPRICGCGCALSRSRGQEGNDNDGGKRNKNKSKGQRESTLVYRTGMKVKQKASSWSASVLQTDARGEHLKVRQDLVYINRVQRVEPRIWAYALRFELASGRRTKRFEGDFKKLR